MKSRIGWIGRTAVVLIVPTCSSLQAAVAQGATAAKAVATQAHPMTLAWVFKPKVSPYVAPNRPVWHIKEILAAYRGKADWAQPVIKDRWFNIQYISMGPGKKTRTKYEADTAVWFIVYSGKIRFTIQGHAPFVASKDFLVQVPMRTSYRMETVGDTPSVRLQVSPADSAPVFPVSDNPTPPTAPPGYRTVKVEARSPRQSTASKPPRIYLDYDKEVIDNPNAPRRVGFFVRNVDGFAVPIRSRPIPIPAASNIGHFHTGLAEFWYVLEGDMDVRIEGLPNLVKAHQGDLVYAPMGRYHKTIMVGGPYSTRLAMGGVIDSGASFWPLTVSNK